MTSTTRALRFARALALAGTTTALHAGAHDAHAQDFPSTRGPACPATLPRHRSRCRSPQQSCSYRPPNHVPMRCICYTSSENPRRAEWYCHHPMDRMEGPLPPPDLADAAQG